MKHYTQLNQKQRYQISGLLKAGWKQSEIATEVGVNKGTISRELKRNAGKRGWCPGQAQVMRNNRRQGCINGRQFSPKDWQEVERLTRLDLSPEQVSERLEFEGTLQISHEIIYQRIYADKRNGGDLYLHLRSQKPRRKRYASGQQRRGVLKNRVSIDERPEIVAEKSRIGDWEGDTVIGKNHKEGVLDFV